MIGIIRLFLFMLVVIFMMGQNQDMYDKDSQGIKDRLIAYGEGISD